MFALAVFFLFFLADYLADVYGDKIAQIASQWGLW